MPRRQRFKPSRKPKPAIEPSDQEVIAKSEPRSQPDQVPMTSTEEMHPEDAEERVPR